MPVLYDNPQEVGADRIVNSVAAYSKYGGPCIVVDFGTAINFDVISTRGEYMGGVLAPGIGISSESTRSDHCSTSTTTRPAADAQQARRQPSRICSSLSAS